MATTVAQVPALRITRLIKAPRERVFAAWTTAAEIVKWFGPETCRTVSANLDLRVGGEYHIRVKSDETGELELRGAFREVKRPSKLVYTWIWEGLPQVEFSETVVKVDFLERNGFTDVQITHEDLPNEEQRQNHEHGWNGSLDKLERLMADNAEGEQPYSFCWNELLAKDVDEAAKFYCQIFGWQTVDFPGGINYTLFQKAGRNVGGLMRRPTEDCQPQWMSYVTVKDVDLTLKKVTESGGKITMPATDIPAVGRVAVFEDSQGASLGIIKLDSNQH